MESDRLLPAIGLLEAISPDPDRPDNDTLTYPSLDRAMKDGQSFEAILLNTYHDARDEPTAQLVAAHKLAEYELIETAAALQRAQTPARQQELSRQFTAASIDLFGSPDPITATFLLEQLLTELCVLQTNYNVDQSLLDFSLETYDRVLRHSNAPHEYYLPFDESALQAAAGQFAAFLHSRYPGALAVFAGEPTQRIEVTGIVERFERALEVLAESEAFWSTWQVSITADSCLSVNPVTKRLIVGSRRALAPLGELKGLFGHEVLVHALRASNGQHVSHEFAYGLPGYIDAEEGFACFVEHALLGRPPQKMYDRYLDIALALGTIDGRARTRHDLFRLVRARNLVRAGAAGVFDQDEQIERESWAHVNRIFRGTLGNDIVGVFTKDIAYYQGYQKMAAFTVHELAAGTSVEDLWSVLTLGKYDPTDFLHVLELARKT